MHWTYKIQEINGIKYFKIEGVDEGSANLYGLKIIKETEHFVLCRKSGYAGWFAIGQQTYRSPSYNIYKKSEDEIVELLCGIWEKEYSRNTMKDAKKEALQKIEELEKGEN